MKLSSILPCLSFLLALAFSSLTNAQSKITLEKDKPQMTDSLLRTIDMLHDKANAIEDLSEKGFNLKDIKSGLPQIVRDINSIKIISNLNINVMDLIGLQTFKTLLDNSHEQLYIWRNLLLGYNRQLVNMQNEIELLRQNKLLKSYQSDSLFIKLYTTELISIEKSWAKARHLTSRNLKEISTLQAAVTSSYYEAGDLQKELSAQMRSYSVRVMGKEYPFLWNAQSTKVDQQAMKFLNASLLTQQQLIAKYLKENFTYHMFLSFLILAAFIYWIRTNRKKLLLQQKEQDWLEFKNAGKFSLFPLLTGLIIVLNLAPFFDLDPPQAYISLLQLMLFIVVSIFVFRHWPKKNKLYWSLIGISFLALIGLSGVLNPGKGVRVAMLVLNLFLGLIAYYNIRNKSWQADQNRFAKRIGYLFLILNVLAVLLNLAGRVTLAKVYTSAGIFGFIQLTALSIFMNAIKTAFTLHVHTVSAKNNGSSMINYETLNSSVSRFLSVIVVVLWIIVFLSNINLYNPLIEVLDVILFKPRMVGSTSFTIGNVLLFFLVIYLSSLAQKYVGYFFGENQGHTAPGERKGSRVVLTKLLIILIGFLLAVMVSGLPVDKITVILGAFGVGIGLGLQAIVNNFVSGVILIFERPLQVGDYVEVSGYKGWVNDIGIRATRLSSSEGAEILVPNGSILSGNLVNWTLSNSQIRLELNLKIEPQHKTEEAKKIILEILGLEEEVINSRQPEVFNHSVSGEAAELKVWFWIAQVSRQQMVRSNLVTKIYSSFAKNEIKLL